METFLLAFIPLLVAIDPLATLPMFVSLTHGFTPQQKRRLAIQAVLTAFLVGVGFDIMGSYLFSVLGITPSDFRIAGGLLLLIISIREIFGPTSKNMEGGASNEVLGIVPLGIPLIAGPAVMTTILILHDIHSFTTIVAALAANLLIVLVFLFYSDQIIRRLGEAASKGLAKVIAIFLAAIAIMMIRQGVELLLLKK